MSPWRQVRSLGAESARVADARRRRRQMAGGGGGGDWGVVDVDWFTLDFNEELSALHGRSVYSFPFPLNLSLLCPFPLDLSSLCPLYNPNYSVDVARRCSS